MDTFVVVGAGISGLLSAYLLKSNDPTRDVWLIEKDDEFGGLLKSFNYQDGKGVFDMGIHTVYDTGIEELDNLIKSFIPLDEWIELSGRKRDFGGTYFNKTLQKNVAYIDVRNFDKSKQDEYIDDFFCNLNKNDPNTAKNAKEYLSFKYGDKLTKDIFEKIVSKLYSFPLEETHSFIAQLLPFGRIVLLEDDIMEVLGKSASVRNSIGFTDQLLVPEEFVASKSAWYPKSYGMQTFVSAIISKLEEIGVNTLSSSFVKSSTINTDDTLNLVVSSIKNEDFTIPCVKKLVWTSGIPSAYFTLTNETKKNFAFDKPVRTCFVNIGLKSKPEVNGFYYLYCLEAGFITHRLSCPFNFCEASYKDGIYRLTVEVILKDDLEDDQIIEKVKKELEVMKVASSDDILFSEIEHTKGGYPSISNKNINAINEMRDLVKNEYKDSISFYGMMSKPDLFFQVDVLTDLYNDLAPVR